MATTVTDETVMKSVSERLARYVADGDLDGLRTLYTPDARIWHNTDDTSKTVDESLAFFGALVGVSTAREYQAIRLTPTPTGFVQQHYLSTVLSTGETVRAPICMVITLEGDRVKTLDEYIESGSSSAVEDLLRGS